MKKKKSQNLVQKIALFQIIMGILLLLLSTIGAFYVIDNLIIGVEDNMYLDDEKEYSLLVTSVSEITKFWAEAFSESDKYFMNQLNISPEEFHQYYQLSDEERKTKESGVPKELTEKKMEANMITHIIIIGAMIRLSTYILVAVSICIFSLSCLLITQGVVNLKK